MSQPNEATGERPAKTQTANPSGDTVGEVDAAAAEDLRGKIEEQAKADAEARREGIFHREAIPEFGGESFTYGQRPEQPSDATK